MWERLTVTMHGLEDRTPIVATTMAGVSVLVVKLDGTVYAIGNACTHAGGPLNQGAVAGPDRCEVECPWHGSRFSVHDGRVTRGPATLSVVRFDVRTDGDGFIEVRAGTAGAHATASAAGGTASLSRPSPPAPMSGT